MSAPTAFVLPRSVGRHDTGPGHPECAARVEAIRTAFDGRRGAYGDRIAALAPERAPRAELLRVHPERHLAALDAAVDRARRGGRPVEFAPETPVSAATTDAILASLGGVLEAVRGVAAGRFRNAFVVTRPPGHHCSADAPMGFCPVNLVAVAARWIVQEGVAERVLIVDWDVHHGNGTQEIFRSDPAVFYLSLHQSPWYPGTGAAGERGTGEGEGTTLNVPLPAGTGADVFLAELGEALDRVLETFRPEAVLVSSGFDALASDPLGGFRLEPSDFHAATRILMARAGSACEGRIVALLEGGYDPAATAAATMRVLDALCGVDAPEAEPARGPTFSPLVG